MARVNTPEVIVDISDNTERTVEFTLNKEQVYDALFTWMRLNGIDIPSKVKSDYNICVTASNYSPDPELKITFTYKHNL